MKVDSKKRTGGFPALTHPTGSRQMSSACGVAWCRQRVTMSSQKRGVSYLRPQMPPQSLSTNFNGKTTDSMLAV